MSVRKIAQRAGVSIATVSRVLNGDPTVRSETRESVLTAANESGYMPTVGRRITSNVGFAYLQHTTVSHRFDAALLEGVMRGLNEARFDLVILNVQRDRLPDETYTQFFMRKGVRGVVLRTTTSTREACRAIADEGFPHVVISEQFDEPNVCYIDGDSRDESMRAVEYLIALGHRRIAFAAHNLADRDHLDRLAGYKAALAAHKIPVDSKLIFRQPATLAGGATVVNMLMSMSNRPTAVYFADPMLAVGGIKEAIELGVHVPDDLSIVGFDDTDVRLTTHPTLTAVCQDASALGYEAARWLGRALRGLGPRELRKTTPTFLEINDSTGPAPALSEAGADAENRNQ
ncbi:MAG: LacI family transcriptional regulator [Planctomycetota bacterium]|nr:MAG: LacI family transcriptional regulator [Planctomycetota bacterium]